MLLIAFAIIYIDMLKNIIHSKSEVIPVHEEKNAAGDLSIVAGHILFSVTLQFTLFEVQRQHLKVHVHHGQSLKQSLNVTDVFVEDITTAKAAQVLC